MTRAMKPATPSKPSLCEDIVERIKGMIRDGRYGPGAQLPAERDLARELGVSRASVREALRTLSIMGMLETRHGSGTHVSLSSVNVLRTSFQFMLILDKPSIADLYETRELLEVHLAGRAAERRSEEDMQKIEQALADMSRSTGDLQAWTEANVRFHEGIATAAHSPVLDRFISCIHDGIKACIEAANGGVTDWKESLAVHIQVTEAIRRRNPADARRAMTVHMGRAMIDVTLAEHRTQLTEVP
jgi:GntR family transcriptional repressor for pyruvate dehydrogenase complex